MARGRTPTPTNILKMRGTYRASRRRNEPRPRQIAPSCPRWLSRIAQTEWRRVAPELERLGMLTPLDMAGLAAYCDAYATWRKAMKVLHESGLTFKVTATKTSSTKSGKTTTTKTAYVQRRPELAIANAAMRQVRAWCLEFGMTPSARGRMRLPDETPSDDELEDFLNRGK